MGERSQTLRLQTLRLKDIAAAIELIDSEITGVTLQAFEPDKRKSAISFDVYGHSQFSARRPGTFSKCLRLRVSTVAGQQDRVERSVNTSGSDKFWRQREAAMRAYDLKPFRFEQCCACGTYEESYVPPGVRQTSAEISAGRAGSHNQ